MQISNLEYLQVADLEVKGGFGKRGKRVRPWHKPQRGGDFDFDITKKFTTVDIDVDIDQYQMIEDVNAVYSKVKADIDQDQHADVDISLY